MFLVVLVRTKGALRAQDACRADGNTDCVTYQEHAQGQTGVVSAQWGGESGSGEEDVTQSGGWG